MLAIMKLAISGATSGVAGRWEGEAKFCELDRLIPVYIAHFQRLVRTTRRSPRRDACFSRDASSCAAAASPVPPPAHAAFPPQRLDLALPDGHPLLSTAARMIAEAKEACADYRHRIETNRNSRVAEAVDTAKELAGGVVGIKYWETRFSELLSKLQSLVVASLTLTAETVSSPTAGADAAAASASDANAPVLEYLSHCFSLVRLECEVPKPPGPADGGFPGFVWTGDDAPYSGRLDAQWERPPGPAVGFDGGADVDADASLYRSRPRRYQLWCERSFDVVQGSLNQLRQLGVDDFLEPTAIGLGRHVMEVESEDDIVRTHVVGQSEGLAAGTKYAMAVRAWLNPPPGCNTAWSKWSDWSHIGCTSPTHQVVADLRCIASSEHGLTIAWSRPSIPAAPAPPPSPSGVVQVEIPMDESEIDAAAAAGDGGYEYEYQIRMELTGASVQTLQAKVADTAAQALYQMGVWHEEAAVPAAVVGGGGTPTPAVLAEPEPEPEPEPVTNSTLNPASTGAGVWDAVGGDTKQQKLEASQQQKLEAALLEAATILPDERAIVRGTVTSHEPMVAYRAGKAPTDSETNAWEQSQSDGGIGLGLLGSPRAASPSGSPRATSVLLRAGSKEVENLEAGVTYRVSVRARIISENIASASADGPPTTTDWGGWCPVVDMQTQAATLNPPPIVESPPEGWEVSVGEGCEIRWTGRQQVTEVLFTSRSGVYKHSLLVPTDTVGKGDTGGSFWWRGDLWPGADAAANGLYADTPTPNSFPTFVYLKFVGLDGMETYTPARRITMEYTPLLQINSPPSGGMVPDYGNADGDTDRTETEPYAVASATAGEPIDIRWDMMEGVKVSSISLNDRSTWLTSAYRGSPPVYTIVGQPELSAMSTSFMWDGRLGINIVDVAAAITRESDADALMEAADLVAAGGASPSSAGPAQPAVRGDSGGALPSAKPYDIVVHFTAPAHLGGASQSVRVPIDLDEPFEMVSWGAKHSPARPSAPAKQADAPRVTMPLGPVSGDEDESELLLESTELAEVVVPPGMPPGNSPGRVNI